MQAEQIKTVLVIDDSDTDRYIVGRALRKSGIIVDRDQLVCAGDGLEALELLCGTSPAPARHWPPELVFLDINMPVMNGFEFLDEYEQWSARANVIPSAIVLLSSSDHDCDKQRAARYRSIAGYLVKHPTRVQLADFIHELPAAA